MVYPRYLRRSLTLLFVFVCMVPMLLAKEETMNLRQQSTVHIDNALPPSQEATTTPFSHTQITLQISVDGHEPVILTQREGGLIRIEKLPSEQGDPAVMVGFTPYISDLETEAVSVKATRITRIVKGGAVIGEGIKELDTVSLDQGFAKDFSPSPDAGSTYSLQLIRVVKKGTPEKRVSFTPTPQIGIIQDGYGGNCCVICGGVRYCACYVVASCGSCCVGSCCN